MLGVKTTETLPPSNPSFRQHGLFVLFALLSSVLVCSGAWLQHDGSLAWTEQGQPVWRFNYQRTDGKPFFELASPGGVWLTTVRPADHRWHYGLWFSWKYINGVNYWEEDRKTGEAEGQTRWNEPVIVTNRDGGARIELQLKYVHPSGRVELTERRVLDISPVGTNGCYTIDWRAEFKAGTNTVKLDRTPMAGEPGGQVNGGYAGLSLRMAASPVTVSLVSERGPVTNFVSSRARPQASGLAANFRRDNADLGAIAIVSDAANLPGVSPWYAVVNDQMRFFCSAILAPKPLELKPGASWPLRYCILVQPEPWTAAALTETVANRNR